MFVVAVVSCKGGVGCTTLTASIATVLAQRRYNVLAVDFDPQNCLCMPLSHGGPSADGLVQRVVSGEPWQDAACRNSDRVYFLPFGQVGEAARRSFENLLETEPDWLADRLGEINLGPNTIVLVDCAKGPCVFMRQALRAAHFVLTVVLSDAASYLTIPTNETLITDYTAGSRHFMGSAYVINQANATRPLRKDLLALLRSQLRNRLVPYPVHQDEAVAEALAGEMSVPVYAPQSQAAHDLQGLTDWLLSCRAGLFGGGPDAAA
jgi:cellulose synthase operon protein YhjQ